MQAMVIVTSGTNCDLELAQAFEDAGASCQTVQLHSILDAPEALDGAELVGFPAGSRMAMPLRLVESKPR